ncbi:MAG: assimilatory nitrate reductase alpha subunit apoprotein [Xanthobacteraceae bacterium]|nr:assimilatory nitrate reductase alpha subunit apoprotein [Xanthobacteraceae bacterium]
MNAPSHHPAAVRTTCPYCGVGCGVLAKPDGRGGATVSGDPAHPANFGRLCSKGSALGETLSLEGRLLHPMVRMPDNGLARISWDNALDKVANGFRSIIDQHGPDSVAFYLSGQLLTEDYYVANKLMKGFVGTANVDTNSRLCMASSVAGHRRAFGADTVPGTYEDLDEADLLVLVGSNAAWCHPVLYQRMIANKRERGAKIVVIDPRRTMTAEDADLFLPVAPGTDTALFAGLLVHLADTYALDYGYIDSYTTDFENALARARSIAPDITTTATATGLAPQDVARFFQLFARTEKTVTAFSQGVNQSAQGTDKVDAIINCHLATGRIGKPGTGPFSLTGQPNAMGGREVGGLANQLAAHMGFTPADIDRVGRFWQAPAMSQTEGHKAVAMFDAIAHGEIKALWVMATNPAVSLPRAGFVRDALSKLELFVVSENVLSNDTVQAGAHILLPAAAWGEKDGTVTNSERRISRQRPFLTLPGEAKPDWWMVAEVAKRLGFGEAFAYRGVADVFREHAALSAFENNGTRDFDIGGLANVSGPEFNALEPIMWPVRTEDSSTDTRFFAKGGFFTSDRKARFIAPEKPAPRMAVTTNFPFRLNTGRVRDQWHTMTRTGLSPRLGSHSPEPFVEVHPDDLTKANLTNGGFARITTPYGSCLLKVTASAGQRPGSLFVPIHWSAETASSARVGELVNPHTDPFSGQPEVKATPAAIVAVDFAYRGFALGRTAIPLPQPTWWARVTVTGGTGYLLATNDAPERWQERARALFPDCELAEYIDGPRGLYRIAAFREGRLEGCLFVGPAAHAPQWDSVKALFEMEAIEDMQRRMLLSGKPADGIAEIGPVICACFGVGLNTIREALASGAATNVETIGQALRAGTNCGSCLPELKRIVHDRVPQPV